MGHATRFLAIAFFLTGSGLAHLSRAMSPNFAENGGPTQDALLSATWLGTVGAEAGANVALSWRGAHPAWVEIFEDADGNGERGLGERVVLERMIEPGMEVVPLGEVKAVALALRWRGDGAAGSQRLRSAEKGVRCGWQGADLDGAVFAMTVWDDGGGPALYVGGDFPTAAGVHANYVAKWDGSAWSALVGPSAPGVSSTVRALAAWNDGNGEGLYVGGTFTSAGGVPASRIAKWDGNAWSALPGPTLNEAVYALTVWDDGSGEALYAAGSFFAQAGHVMANRVAKWNGSAWSTLGSGTNSTVYALAVWDDGSSEALYVGGNFLNAGGLSSSRVAKWSGSAWSALGSGTSSAVYALATWDGALYAGGDFLSAGGVAVNRVAKWNGTGWSALSGLSGTGVNDAVAVLTVYDDGGGTALYAGGPFTLAGGEAVGRVAKWDGNAWSALSGPAGAGMDSVVHALTAWDDGEGMELYAGGFFTEAGGKTVSRVAKWGGGAWSPLAGPFGGGLNGPAFALAVWDDGGGEALYVGGDFTMAGGKTVNHVAKWDGTVWSALTGPAGTGTNEEVLALEVWGGALYAGGAFTQAGGAPANRIARWNGSGWSPVGAGTNDTVHALTVWNGALYVGGKFNQIGTLGAAGVARWNGSWSSLGLGLLGPGRVVRALAGWNGALYAGGWFTAADNVPVSHIASWNGSVWSSVGGGVNNQVESLAAWDGFLYVGGWFFSAGSVITPGVARWNGSTWSAPWSPYGPNGPTFELEVWDDGRGEALALGGLFQAVAGAPAEYVAKWDGSAWSAFAPPPGMDEAVMALVAWDDGRGEALYAAGYFTTAGGRQALGIARLVCDDVADPHAPTNPTMISSSHLPGTWSDDATIDMVWSGAADEPGGSGLDRYRVRFDGQPTTIPGASSNVVHTSDPHSTTSAMLADGSWYFHLSTCDVADNCAGPIHLGPYFIDTVAPSTPGGPSSSSHSVGVPSPDATVDVAWSASVDAGAGLAGYAWTFLQAPSWLCDGLVDGPGTSVTSAALANGEWWFHVCAIDAAGNQSPVATAGPFPISAPSILLVDTVADTGDSDLENGEVTAASITQLVVYFAQPVSEAAQQPDSWSLVATGPDGVFDSLPCGPTTGDLDYQPFWPFLVGDDIVVLFLNHPGTPLPAGQYRFAVCPAITDLDGNPVVSEPIYFTVLRTNLIPNPNVNVGQGLPGWEAGGTRPSGLGASAADAEGKWSSGSIEFTTNGVAGETTIAHTCVGLVPGQPIVVGGALDYLGGGPGTNAQVRVRLTGSSVGWCAAPASGPTTVLLAGAPTAGWQAFAATRSGQFESVEVAFEVESGTSLGEIVRLDLIALYAPLFADGFETGTTSGWSATVP